MDFFNSFFQNVKDKLTSPFFGTLGFILIIHHWEFWYILFNFSSRADLHIKITILRTVGVREFHWRNLCEDILWTLLIVFVGYAIVIGTRTLSLFIEHNLMPSITKRVISKGVVIRSEFEAVLEERDHYAEKYETERKYSRVLSKSYDEQLEEIKEKNRNVTENNEQITQINTTNNGLNQTISQLNKRIQELTVELDNNKKQIISQEQKIDNLTEFNQIASTIFFDKENDLFWKHLPSSVPSMLRTVNDIKSSGLWTGFKNAVKFEKQGGSIGVEIYTLLEPFNVIRQDKTERLNLLGLLIAHNLDKFESNEE